MFIITKERNSGADRWKTSIGQDMWEGVQSFHAFSEPTTLPGSLCVHQYRSSPNPSFWVQGACIIQA